MSETRREFLKTSLAVIGASAAAAACGGCLTVASGLTEAVSGPTLACDARYLAVTGAGADLVPQCTSRFCRYYRAPRGPR
jgi:hypothetical protein